jgi:alkylhydroperoxidase family enzyme
VESRGQVSDADLAAVRGAGYTDPQILAIVTVAVQVLLTNFINNVNQTDIDIPAVSSVGTPG